jgi:hypothetical protein
MNVEIRTEAAQFPEKEYINGIFVAVYQTSVAGPIQNVFKKEIIDIFFTLSNNTLLMIIQKSIH